MEIGKLKEILKDFNSDVKFEHDLRKKNWFNIGGKSKIFYQANTLKELINFLKKLDNKEKIFILGAGSNTLISDDLFDGVVIKLSKNFSNISLHSEDIIIAGSGVTDKKLSEFAYENSLSGFEFLSCIPGTVGGALITNAGANGGEISDVLVSVFFIKNGKEIEVKKEEIEFKYRTSSIKRNEIITKAKFLLKKGDPDKARVQIKEYLNHRNNTQPVRWPSAGSVFKNPLPDYAGLIIENLGLKGLSVGDAQVSNIHSNYIINKNNASPENILSLVNRVKDKVLKDTGIKLENEIRIIDEK